MKKKLLLFIICSAIGLLQSQTKLDQLNKALNDFEKKPSLELGVEIAKIVDDIMARGEAGTKHATRNRMQGLTGKNALLRKAMEQWEAYKKSKDPAIVALKKKIAELEKADEELKTKPVPAGTKPAVIDAIDDLKVIIDAAKDAAATGHIKDAKEALDTVKDVQDRLKVEKLTDEEIKALLAEAQATLPPIVQDAAEAAQTIPPIDLPPAITPEQVEMLDTGDALAQHAERLESLREKFEADPTVAQLEEYKKLYNETQQVLKKYKDFGSGWIQKGMQLNQDVIKKATDALKVQPDSLWKNIEKKIGAVLGIIQGIVDKKTIIPQEQIESAQQVLNAYENMLKHIFGEEIYDKISAVKADGTHGSEWGTAGAEIDAYGPYKLSSVKIVADRLWDAGVQVPATLENKFKMSDTDKFRTGLHNIISEKNLSLYKYELPRRKLLVKIAVSEIADKKKAAAPSAPTPLSPEEKKALDAAKVKYNAAIKGISKGLGIIGISYGDIENANQAYIDFSAFVERVKTSQYDEELRKDLKKIANLISKGLQDPKVSLDEKKKYVDLIEKNEDLEKHFKSDPDKNKILEEARAGQIPVAPPLPPISKPKPYKPGKTPAPASIPAIHGEAARIAAIDVSSPDKAKRALEGELARLLDELAEKDIHDEQNKASVQELNKKIMEAAGHLPVDDIVATSKKQDATNLLRDLYKL